MLLSSGTFLALSDCEGKTILKTYYKDKHGCHQVNHL